MGIWTWLSPSFGLIPRAVDQLTTPLTRLSDHDAKDAEQALDYLVSKATPDDAVFVTGSLYLVGQLRHYWKQRAQVAAR